MDDGVNDNGSVLNTRVLVLNKLFSAIRVITARRAFTLLAKNNAEVITKDNGTFATYDFPNWVKDSQNNGHQNGDDFVHTPNWRVKVPRVIRLLSYEKLPRYHEKVTRKSILARDEYRCQYCGKYYSAAILSVDHIIPKSRAGLSNWDNLVACCSKCNTKKGGRLPHEAGMKLLKKPTTPKVSPIFASRLKEAKYALWKEFVTEKDK